jgi:serine protease Do
MAAVLVAASSLGLGDMWGGSATIGAQTRSVETLVGEQPPVEAQEHANSLSTAFRNAAEKTMPAVVTIQRTSQARPVAQRSNDGERSDDRDNRGRQRELPEQFRDLDPLLKRFFEDFEGRGFDMDDLRQMPSRPSQSQGSGVIIDKSGLILTNNHVVAGGGKVVVKLYDGREFEATEVKTDPSTDLAIVRIDAGGDLPTAKLGDSDQMRVGDWVLALGQPFGLNNTVTAGIVSAKGRGIGLMEHEEFIQTDAAINPGNSGGPLVNLDGEVVGINTAISSTSGGYQGVGFAVPVNVAKWVSSQLDKDGVVHRAYLGVGIQPVTQDLSEQLGMKTPHGALVTEVRPGSPAEKAGVKVGDVITDYAGSDIASPSQLSAVVARTRLGSKQPLAVIRDGKEVTLNVNVQEMPENYKVSRASRDTTRESEGTSVEKLGLEAATLTAERAEQLGIKSAEGVLITAVDDDSLAGRAGLQAGMVIERIGQTQVKNVEQLEAAMEKASLEKGVLMLVRTGVGSRFVVVKEE